MSAKIACMVCGSIFGIERHLTAGPRQRRYCSRRCYYAAPHKRGPESHAWKGGVTASSTTGRKLIYSPERPREGTKPYTYEHILIAEKALGRILPPKVAVHHVDENPYNNTPGNLVVCQDQAYHLLLHRRMRIVRAGGNPNRQSICGQCRQLKDNDQFYPSKRNSGVRFNCKSCQRDYAHEKYLQAKGSAA